MTRRERVSDEVDAALRADVSLLGGLLGRVLAEGGGPELLDDVERLRALAIAAFESGLAADTAAAEALVDGFAPERAEQVARAFTVYFHLVNLAEEHHRVRVLRTREASRTDTDSLPAAIERLAVELGSEAAAERLNGLRFHPVLTAHPTEARRRAVASAIRRVAELLAERDGAAPGARSTEELDRRLLEEIDILWRTSPVRTTRPTPLDEVRTAMSIFDQTLFEVVPQVYRLLDDRLAGSRAGFEPVQVPAFVRFGTWIAGDRDGNPFVTHETTEEAAGIAAEHVLLGLERAATRVGRTLTLDEGGTPPSDALLALMRAQESLATSVVSRIGVRAPFEPHRRVLLVVAERIAATRRADATLAYASPEELLKELRTVQHSLAAAGAAAARTASCRGSSGRSRPSASISPSSRCVSTRPCIAEHSRRSGPAASSARPRARCSRSSARSRGCSGATGWPPATATSSPSRRAPRTSPTSPRSPSRRSARPRRPRCST